MHIIAAVQRTVPIERVGFDVDLSCVDGRHSACIVGTPGGSTGELLLLCAAAERLAGQEWATASVLSFASRWIQVMGRLYMHTDEGAIRRVGLTVEDVRAGEPGDRADLLEALSTPDGIGCAHLKLIWSHPDRYEVRRELVEAVIEAFFTLLWTGGAAHYDVLPGAHHEREVLVIRSGDVVPLYCQTGETRAFAAHADVQSHVRKRAARLMLNFGVGPVMGSVTLTQLADEVETLGEEWQEATLQSLAPDLPVRVISGT